MWKRLQRVGKEASKFQFTISLQDIIIDCQNDWYPSCVCMVWSRRDRKENSETHPLVADPDVKNRFMVSLTVPDNLVAIVTLFKNARNLKFEAKNWDLSIYEYDTLLGHQTLNMSDFATGRVNQLCVDVPLKSKHKQVVSINVKMTVSSFLIKRGKATDEDMVSETSFMSLTRNYYGGDDNDLNGDDDDVYVGDGSDRKNKKSKYPQDNKDIIPNFATRYNLAKYLEDNDAIIDDEDRTFNENQILPISQNLSKSSFSNNNNNKQCSTITTSRNNSNNLSILQINNTINKTTDSTTTKTPTPPTSPTQSLFDWCRETTKSYTKVDVTNFTTSWRNGLAFCAIINHYRPDLINFESLDPTDVLGNCKLAFDAGEKLGVPKVIEPSDMVLLKIPDKLSVLTYLFQLKSYFTDNHLHDIMSNSLTSTSKNLHNHPLKREDELSREDVNNLIKVDYKSNECRSPSPYSVLSSTCTSFSPTPVASLERNYNRRINLSTPVSSSLKLENNHHKQIECNLIKNDKINLYDSSKTDAMNNKEQCTKNIEITKIRSMEKGKNKITNDNPSCSSNLKSDKRGNINTNSLTLASTLDCSHSENINTNTENKPVLMTRKQLLNPFDSDEEDENESNKLKVDLNLGEFPTNTLSETKDVVAQIHETEGANKLGKCDSSIKLKTNIQLIQKEDLNEKATDKKTEPTKNKLSRHEELKEQARMLLAKAKASSPLSSQLSSTASLSFPPVTSSLSGGNTDSPTLQEKYVRDKQEIDKRQKELRDRARQLIMEAKGSKQITEVIRRSSGPRSFSDSPRSLRLNKTNGKELSCNKEFGKDNNLSTVVENKAPMYCNDELFDSNEDFNTETKGMNTLEESKPLKKQISIHSTGTEIRNKTSADKECKGTEESEKITHDPKGETEISSSPDKSKYVSSEMEQLEREQLIIDERAATLEWELRRVMKEGDKDGTEEKMLKEWFSLVNRKNALIRRQMQLNLLEKERDLEKRFNLLSLELRKIMSLPDWQKTEDNRMREKLLLAELVELVDKRDELVQNLDSQEQAIEDDEKVEMVVEENLDNKKRAKWKKSSGVGCDGNDTSCTIQ